MPAHDFQFSELTAARVELVRNHLRNLDADSRTMRFGAPVTEEFLSGYAERLAAPGTGAVGAFHEGSLCALAELHPLRIEGSRDIEIALSVEPQWQGRGLGRELARIAASRAAAGACEVLQACFSSSNHRMRKIAIRLGMMLIQDGSYVIGSVDLRRCRAGSPEAGVRRYGF